MTASQIEAQVSRILSSPSFRSSERMSRFLRYAVTASLEGRAGELKESVLGVEVFDRAAGYDPRVDPIVRVEARRLRAKLSQYYRDDGAGDPIVIELPRGGYAPVFRPRESRPEQPAPRTTIAVLPFANLSTDPENQYFSDGLTRELIHELTRVPGLSVVAWNTAAQLREKAGKPREVAEMLKADTVLEGSVQRSGRRVRVTAQLIDAATGVYLWSESYRREFEDIFELQEEIARSLALVLRLRTSTRQPRPHNPEAYNFYLQGRHAWNQRTDVGLRQSITLFERAIEEDPTFALAWAGIADAYSLLCDFGFKAAAEGIPRAREAACRALSIDPSLGEAYCSLGFIRSTHDWEWQRAEADYRRSIELNPGYATAHHWYGTDLLAIQGRFDEAIPEIALARLLDPLNHIVAESESYVYFLSRRFEEADRGYQQLIRRAPEFAKVYASLGRSLATQGRYADSIAMLEKAHSIAGPVPSLLGALGQAHALSGNRVKARAILERLHHAAQQRYVASTCFALIHLGLGEKPEALDWLERAFEVRDLPLAAIKVHPAYDDLRQEPRFRKLVERIGL